MFSKKQVVIWNLFDKFKAIYRAIAGLYESIRLI